MAGVVMSGRAKAKAKAEAEAEAEGKACANIERRSRQEWKFVCS